MTVRLAALADASALRTLFVAVKPELVADYGAVSDHTLAQFQEYVASGSMKVVVDVAPFKGANLWIRRPDGWESLLTLTDKTMTLANRLASVKAMMRFACLSVPGTTLLYGYVKTTGNFSTWLKTNFTFPPCIATDDPITGKTYFAGMAADMLVNL